MQGLPLKHLRRCFVHSQATPRQLQLIRESDDGLHSVISDLGTGKTYCAVERVLYMNKSGQSKRSILALHANSDTQSSFLRSLSDRVDFNSLERQGHTVSSIFAFCQQLLYALNLDRSVLNSNKILVLLMQNLDLIQLERLHSNATSTHFSLKREVSQLLSYFQYLEMAAVEPEQYEKFAANQSGNMQTYHHEYAQAYKQYQSILSKHQVYSWHGLILQLLSFMKSDSGSTLFCDNYTDIVVDELEEMTPAMIQIIARVMKLPSVHSGMSFCNQIANQKSANEEFLLKHLSAASLTCNRISLEENLRSEFSSQMQQMATRVISPAPTEKFKLKIPVLEAYKCLRLDSLRQEEFEIATRVQNNLTTCEPEEIVIACPTYADVARMKSICQHLKIPISDSVPMNSEHLFRHPGVQDVFLLLCVTFDEYDSKSLYDMFRCGSFAMSAQTLSTLAATSNRTHQTLLEAAKDYAIKDIACPDSATIKLFLELMEVLQRDCHTKTALEMTQLIVHRLGFYDKISRPACPEDEQMSLAFAAFLREIQHAQELLQSPYLAFVQPYLIQLGNTQVYLDPMSNTPDAKAVRILSLARLSTANMEAKHLYIVGMSDRRFPGRMRRLGVNIPRSLIFPLQPVRNRTDFLRDCSRLLYAAFSIASQSITVSYACTGEDAQVEEASRLLQPIWTTTNKNSSQDASNFVAPILSSKSVPQAIPEKVLYNLDHLSFSQIAEYQRCPHRYYLHRILHIPSDDTPPLVYGRALHEAIAAFAKTWQSMEFPNGDWKAAEKDALAAFAESWTIESFASKAQVNYLQNQGTQDLMRFMQLHADSELENEVLFVEAPFSFFVEEANVHFRGIWDRVDRNASGEIIIREFKSNISRNKRNLSKLAHNNLQLLLYMFAYERQFGIKSKGAELSIIGTNACKFVPHLPNLEKEMVAIIVETAKKIRAQVFPATPSFFECSLCPYARSCNEQRRL